MSSMEIICSMSHDDALLALQALQAMNANDMDGATAALVEMSTEGLNKLISVLEDKIAERSIQV